MPEEAFSRICAEEWEKMPSRYKERIENVALLVEDEPSDEVRRLEGLGEDETLLGLYQGIPQSARGEGYGVGVTLPDTITIYRLPTLLEVEELRHEAPERDFADLVREVVRDTIWHEVGHYFGHDEDAIQRREQGGTNGFGH